MSLLFFDGFEGGTQVVKPQWAPNGIQGLNTSVTLVRTGSNGLQGAGGGTKNTLTIPASTQVTVGFAYWETGVPFYPVVTFKGDAGATSHVSLCIDHTTRALTLRRGVTGNDTTGTLLATGTGILDDSVWRHVQVQATIADTGGRFTVKLDGVTALDFTGDTKNAGTNSTIDTVFLQGAASTPANNSFDDLWVCDGVDATATQGRPNNGFLGDLKVSGLLPTANGATNTWTPSGTGGNFAQVDEAPPNTTDYVSTSTVGNRDMYAMADLDPAVVQVYGVQVGAYAQKSDAGAAAIKTLVRESGGAVTSEPTAQTLSTTWNGYTGPLLAVKPSDSTQWSVTDVNGVQAGVEAS